MHLRYKDIENTIYNYCKGEIDMDIVDRIEKMRNQRQWSVYKLSLESGVAQSTLATMKQRKTPVKVDALQSICEAFGITLAQFFMEDEQVEVLSEQEKKLIKEFRNLSAKQQGGLIELLSR